MIPQELLLPQALNRLNMITSEQIRAARALLRLEQKNLAELSGVSLPTIKRLETQKGVLSSQLRTSDALASCARRSRRSIP